MDIGTAEKAVRVASGAAFVAVPVVASFSKLDWHFKHGGKTTAGIFIAVAGGISSMLFSYYSWTDPARELIQTSILLFFAVSTFAIAMYYWIFTHYSAQTDAGTAPSWVLPIALIAYVVAYGTIALFSASVLARHDYLIVSGTVLSRDNPVAGASIELQDGYYSTLLRTTSRPDGHYFMALRYSEYQKSAFEYQPSHILVKRTGLQDANPDFTPRSISDLTIPLDPFPATK